VVNPGSSPPGPAGARPVPGLSRLVEVRPQELGALLISSAYHFLVLAAWYVLRPIRDAMGAAGGVDDLPWLFTGTLAAMLAVQPLFSGLVARWPRRKSLPWTYRFFALNLVGFYAAIQATAGSSQLWLGRVFFVWASVFALFVVSVFWAFLDDLFHVEQGKRLFGFVAAGGTLGSVAGSAVTAGLVERLGEAPLLLVSAVLLEAAVLCVRALGRRAGAREPDQARAEREPVGGGLFSGVAHVLRSRYLLGICAFFFLYTIGSTFLYFLQVGIVAAAEVDRAARAALFARIDLWTNVATLTLQLAATGRLLAGIGVGWTLAFLPALSVAGFVTLGLAPTLAVLVIFQVARRAANYAFARPAREILFIPLPREDKYKSKTFVDTFVYRLGDQSGAWASAGLTALGLGAGGIAAVAAPLAGIWLMLALWLGGRHSRMAEPGIQPEAPGAPATAPT
jgi:AAA family ATP:ADP antiporter